MTYLLLIGAMSAVASPSEPCVPLADVEPERLELSQKSASYIASGMMVHFASQSEEQLEDGTFDVQTEMRFTWSDESQTDIVSAKAKTEFSAALGHCWRLASRDADKLIVEVVLAASEGATVLPKCVRGEKAKAPLLVDYAEIVEGETFRANLGYEEDSHQWEVYPPPMPLMHHATGIEWTNLAAFGKELGAARGSTLQAQFVVDSTETLKIPDQYMWFSEHKATLKSVCLLEEEEE